MLAATHLIPSQVCRQMFKLTRPQSISALIRLSPANNMHKHSLLFLQFGLSHPMSLEDLGRC